MYYISIPSLLRILSNGINPETGGILPETFCVHSKTYKSYLNRLANELENIDTPPLKRFHPKRWSDEEVQTLADEWVKDISLERIAQNHERSELAIALKLIVSKIALKDDVLPHLSKGNQLVAESTLAEKEISKNEQ